MQRWLRFGSCLRVCHGISNVRQYSNKPGLPKGKNHLYNVLKVTPHSTQQQIKTAYYKLCQLYHPDKTEGDLQSNHDKFNEISEAYQTLSDATKKKAYDREQQVGPVQGPYNQSNMRSDGFSQREINRHERSNTSTKNYDSWTKDYYRDQLERRDYRAHREKRRKDALYDSSNREDQVRVTIVSLTCFVFMVMYFLTRNK